MQADIVPAQPTDAGELLTLQRAAYLSEGRLHNTFDIPPLTEGLDDIRASIATGLVLKAVAGTRIVGTVRVRRSGRTGHIGRLAVVPDLQGQGLGSRLVAAAEAALDGRTGDAPPGEPLVDRYELFTGPRSEANIRLYRRLGYRQIPTPPGGNPFLVYLEKTVRAADG